ncbi:MAG: endonuclease [Myxococcaceae bacterium]|nr:endonuclease [Myxococcaceae bacterium]
MGLQRPQSRPLATPFTREANRPTPTPAAAPRAAGQSSFSASPSRLDSSSLTRLGATFVPVAARVDTRAARETEQTVRVGATPDLAIPDNSKVESKLNVAQELTLKGGSLSVDIPHTWTGDLVVTLTSPSGKSLTVHDRAGGSADDLKAKFDLSAFAGEPTQGDWKLTVEDRAGADVGTLKAWDLELTGTQKGEEPPPPPPPDDPFQGLRDQALLKAIQQSSSGKHVVSYNEARKEIFTNLDVKDGKVKCVYTGREINGGKIPSSSDMNTEHTWPQSKGATGAAKSDLHHLFPTDSRANSTRGSFPFGKVEKVQWSQNGAKFGLDAQGRKVFEPPDEHKGNVARAMFYFSAEYGKAIPDAEESVLREWNKLDAVDAAELERNRRISEIQGNVNQFVEHSNLADRIRDF